MTASIPSHADHAGKQTTTSSTSPAVEQNDQTGDDADEDLPFLYGPPRQRTLKHADPSKVLIWAFSETSISDH